MPPKLYPALKRWAIFKEILHHRGADVLAAFDADDDLADFILVEVSEKLFALEGLGLDEAE